jgi:hypothetical protein
MTWSVSVFRSLAGLQAEAVLCPVHSPRTRRDPCQPSRDGRTCKKEKPKSIAYLVRRLFCRARALLSTSGGILLATVSCECTRKASAPGGLGTSRLPIACGGDEDGNGEELDIVTVVSSREIGGETIYGRTIGIEATKRKNVGCKLWQVLIGACRRVLWARSTRIYVLHTEPGNFESVHSVAGKLSARHYDDTVN